MILQEKIKSQIQMPKSWRQQKGIVAGDPKGIDWDFIWED